MAAFRCWRLHTKIPFPPRCSFCTLLNVLSGTRPVVAEIWMNTWSFTFPSVNILGYSEAPVSECGDTPNRRRQVKTRSVWLLGTWIVGYGGTQPNKWQTGTCCPMWLKTTWPITRHFLSVSHALLLSEGREVIERKHVWFRHWKSDFMLEKAQTYRCILIITWDIANKLTLSCRKTRFMTFATQGNACIILNME